MGTLVHEIRLRKGRLQMVQPKERSYVMESVWTNTVSHSELTTFTIETDELAVMPDDVLDAEISEIKKLDTLQFLLDVRNQQVPGHGPRAYCRVYRVVGVDVGHPDGLDQLEERTLTLQRLFDIDKNGCAIPCRKK